MSSNIFLPQFSLSMKSLERLPLEFKPRGFSLMLISLLSQNFDFHFKPNPSSLLTLELHVANMTPPPPLILQLLMMIASTNLAHIRMSLILLTLSLRISLLG